MRNFKSNSTKAVLIILALVIGTSRQQCCPTCIADMVANGVTKHDPPHKAPAEGFKPEENICLGLVSSDKDKQASKPGTCCNLKQLKEFSTAVLQARSITAFRKSLLALNTLSYSEFKAELAKLGQNLLAFYQQMNISPALQTRIRQAIQTVANDPELQSINLVTLAVEAQGCQNAMKKLHEDGLCFRCAGAASSFFDTADNTYKVKGESCRATITSCAKFIGFMANFGSVVNTVYELGREIITVNRPVAVTIETLSAALIAQMKTCASDPNLCVTQADKTIRDAVCGSFSLDRDNPAILGSFVVLETLQSIIDVIKTWNTANGARRRNRILEAELEHRRSLEKLEVVINRTERKLRRIMTATGAMQKLKVTTDGGDLNGADFKSDASHSRIVTLFKSIIVLIMTIGLNL